MSDWIEGLASIVSMARTIEAMGEGELTAFQYGLEMAAGDAEPRGEQWKTYIEMSAYAGAFS